MDGWTDGHWVVEAPIFGHLMRTAHSMEKMLILEKIEGRKRTGWQRMRWLDGITNSMDRTWRNSGRCWGSGRPVHGVAKSQAWLGDWTTKNELLEGTDVGPRDFTFSFFFSSAQQRLLVKYLNRAGCRLTQDCLSLSVTSDSLRPHGL